MAEACCAITIYGDWFDAMIGLWMADPTNLPLGAFLLLMEGLELWHAPWVRKPRIYDVA